MSHFTDLTNDLEFIEALFDISKELESYSVDKITRLQWLKQQTLMYFRFRYRIYFEHRMPWLVWILAYKYFRKVKLFIPLWEIRHLVHMTFTSLPMINIKK